MQSLRPLRRSPRVAHAMQRSLSSRFVSCVSIGSESRSVGVGGGGIVWRQCRDRERAAVVSRRRTKRLSPVGGAGAYSLHASSARRYGPAARDASGCALGGLSRRVVAAPAEREDDADSECDARFAAGAVSLWTRNMGLLLSARPSDDSRAHGQRSPGSWEFALTSLSSRCDGARSFHSAFSPRARAAHKSRRHVWSKAL